MVKMVCKNKLRKTFMGLKHIAQRTNSETLGVIAHNPIDDIAFRFFAKHFEIAWGL